MGCLGQRYIHPYVAILGGYKKVRQEIDFVSTQVTENLVTGETATGSLTSFSDIDIEGPTIGIAASVPIGRGFGVYASYAHGFLDAEIRDVQRTFNGEDLAGTDCTPACDVRAPDTDATYNVAELGFSYTHGRRVWLLICRYPPRPSTPATDTRTSAPSSISRVRTARNVTKGFAVGVNLTF